MRLQNTPEPRLCPAQNWPREHTPIGPAWRGNNGRGARERARRSGRPNSEAAARARLALPGDPGSRPVPLTSSPPGARPTCGAGSGLHLPNRVRAIVKALAAAPIHALLPGGPEITAPAGRAHTSPGVRCPRGVVAAPAPGEAAGRDAGNRCKKKLWTRYWAHLGQGSPASPRRAGTCRCHLATTRSVRAGGGTCEAGRLGRGARAGGEAAPHWLRRGAQQPPRAPGGARSLRIPRPRRRHLAIASPTSRAAAPPL